MFIQGAHRERKRLDGKPPIIDKEAVVSGGSWACLFFSQTLTFSFFYSGDKERRVKRGRMKERGEKENLNTEGEGIVIFHITY